MRERKRGATFDPSVNVSERPTTTQQPKNTKKMKPKEHTECQFYLFSKLFDLIVGHKFRIVEYDTAYGVIHHHHEEYKASKWNDGSRPEYECMEGYLMANADTISITTAD